jgi:phosphinothricin acetyltransferase
LKHGIGHALTLIIRNDVIRSATPDDAARIAEIYAPYVRGTAVSFETEAPNEAAVRERILAISIAYPWLVCESDGMILGYAYASGHSERAAYKWSVDTTVYVDAPVHRRGIGRALYASLLAVLRHQGYRRAYACVTLPNEPSIGLHEALGFRNIGVFHGVGFKLGAWRDVAWLGIDLNPELSAPGELRSPATIQGKASWAEAMRLGETHLKV